MSKDLSFDLGTIIAYLVPGTLALVLLGHWIPAVADLLSLTKTSQGTAGVLLFVTVLAFATGMLVSVIRGSFLDQTFKLNLRRILPFLPPHYAALSEPAPDFAALAKAGALDLFQEAQLRYQRPYQFYGSLFMLGFGLMLMLRDTSAPLGYWVGVVFAMLCLYMACRKAYSRFVHALEQLNRAGAAG